MTSKTNTEPTDDRPSALVSVVVTTSNEEKNIGNCLQSIKGQTYPENSIEIIVVDNQSRDKTKEIAKNFTDLVFDKGPERSAQRNFGILSVAKGSYVLFLDADMILSPSLVIRCVRTIKSENCMGLYLPEIILGRSYWCRVRRFERSFYDGTVIDVARFIRKEVFEQIGGFDESMSGPEDWDFDKELRSLGKVGIVNGRSGVNGYIKKWDQTDQIFQLGVDSAKYGAVIFHNESEFDLKTYIKKKGYYSQDMDRYIEKWGRADRDIRKQLGFFYRFLGVYMENGKWKRFAIHPGLVMGMYVLRFLVGLQFLMRKTL